MSWLTALKVGGALAIVAAVGVGTWWTTSTWYEKKIAEAQVEALEAGRLLERDEATKTIEVMNGRYVELKKEADRTSRERDDARRLADRLRRSSGAGAVSGEAADPRCADRAELAECRGFLAESVGLLQEAREGWRETAGERDALIDLAK